MDSIYTGYVDSLDILILFFWSNSRYNESLLYIEMDAISGHCTENLYWAGDNLG